MWYRAGWRNVSLAYATSDDGLRWRKHPRPVLADVQQPEVIDGATLYYTDGAGELRRASSADGLAWTVEPEPVIAKPAGVARWGNRAMVGERMLLEGLDAGPCPVWRLYDVGRDAEGWLLGEPLLPLGPIAGAMEGGPQFSDGALWFHAASTPGNLPTDIWRAVPSGNGWLRDARPVLSHRPPWDQVADPQWVDGLLFADEDDNPRERAQIIVARPPAP
jgi:hypothetical protein